jgi:hypothetical protein
MRHRYSFFESVTFLALIGVLAGVLGGLAIGVVTGRPTAPSTNGAK